MSSILLCHPVPVQLAEPAWLPVQINIGALVRHLFCMVVQTECQHWIVLTPPVLSWLCCCSVIWSISVHNVDIGIAYL